MIRTHLVKRGNTLYLLRAILIVGLILFEPGRLSAMEHTGSNNMPSANIEMIGLLVFIVVLLGAIILCYRILWSLDDNHKKIKL